MNKLDRLWCLLYLCALSLVCTIKILFNRLMKAVFNTMIEITLRNGLKKNCSLKPTNLEHFFTIMLTSLDEWCLFANVSCLLPQPA
jgi:hypothetical protein